MSSLMKFSYSSDLPYPDLTIERPNPIYGRAMLDNIGGTNSEMSAVSLYFYNHLVTEGFDQLPDIFHHISIVEMHHLEIFGNLARQLGENPRLWTYNGRRKTYWSPACNQYPLDLQSLLLNSLQREQAAVAKYEAQYIQIQDACIKANLRRIIADEELHITIFQQLCDLPK